MSEDIIKEPVMTVTMSMSDYDELIERSFKLDCLENGGVEEWEYYNEALSVGGYFAIHGD